jgi:hypothetical protein
MCNLYLQAIQKLASEDRFNAEVVYAARRRRGDQGSDRRPARHDDVGIGRRRILKKLAGYAHLSLGLTRSGPNKSGTESREG